jgi:hypothetical protein
LVSMGLSLKESAPGFDAAYFSSTYEEDDRA